ncbi:MAG: methionine--tRNA ligase [Spartobacteria bacterium]|nr:methionine--tRNA ligase [Spartobacteria bacterium]
MGNDAFYVTTPIYYVNDQPHIGHAYTTILADVMARYHRMLGEPTFFLTGTDEHGQKVAKAAREQARTPQEQADHTVVRFQALWERLEITHDDFIRTTEKRHTRVVQEILQRLYDAGEIYRDEYDGWYCTPCERFFMEKDLQEGCCPECQRPVDQIREANYFFRMSQYQQWLIDYIEANPGFIQPAFRANETLGFLRRELNDLCISRPKSRLDWGIELPFDADFVTYVWFDALVNYISAVGYLSDDATFNTWWPASCHLIGKDILTTHTVYWPTMLKAMNLPMPKTIFAHGWWLIGESKMSKSLGNVVNPMDMADTYGVDPFRYFLMAEMTLGQDAAFTEEAFVRRFNSDLANDLGNLVSRVVKMIHSYLDGTVPTPSPDALEAEPDQALWAVTVQAIEQMEQAILSMKIDAGIAHVLTAIRATNRYLEQKEPWKQAKLDDKVPLSTTLYMALEVLHVASALLLPVMPGKMAALREQLGAPSGDPDFPSLKTWGALKPGTPIAMTEGLFPRIVVEKEPPAGAPPKANAGGKAAKKEKTPATPEGVQLISYDDFMQVKLRTAKVLNAEPIEGADKLLRLEVMIGEERRQLVAGIALFYKPEDLIGKSIVVVANLKPAKIRGIESNGMLLAANKGEKMRLITVDGEIASGAEVR